MSDFPKFLLASNEAALPGAAFIIHTQQPLIVGQVVIRDTEEEIQELIKEGHQVGSLQAYGKRHEVPMLVVFVGFLSPPEIKDEQQFTDKLAKIMRRMADWYYFNYMADE